MKLKFRLSLMIFAVMSIVITAISFILLRKASNLQTKTAEASTANLASAYAVDFQRRFENYLQTAIILSEIFDGFEEEEVLGRRAGYNSNMKAILTDNPNYLGIFTVWKPNALDGLDAQYAGTEGTDQSGRYISWFNRNSGEIRLEPYDRYREITDTVSQGGTISNPEFRRIGDRDILVVDIIVPIVLEGGEQVGIVGVNIDISVMEEIVSTIKPFETGVATVYSNDGTIAAHNIRERTGAGIELDRNLFGDEMESVRSAIREGRTYKLVSYSDTYETQLHVLLHPFTVTGTETPWSIMLGVPMDKVLAEVRNMTVFSSIISSSILIVVGIGIFFLVASITKPIIKVADTLKDISEGEGDLTKVVTINSKDEVGDLARSFNATLEKIRALVVIIKDQSVALFNIGNELASNMTETAAAVNQITSNIHSIKSRVINQSASVTETNATMEQITINIDKLNDQVETQTMSVSKSSSAIEQMIANIHSVTVTLSKNAENVKELMDASDVGRNGLQEVSADIQEIARESQGLLEINAVMENIASQTNLLSMNAAIEAAHAGEAGKGFAVVADEIRKLAESSGEQSKTISDVLKKITDAIDKITRSSEEVLSKFEAIDGGVRTVSEQAENIKNAMEEQNVGSQQIMEVIAQLSDITGKVKGGSDEMLEGSREVIQEGKNLEMVTQEITNGINEMATGAEEINTAVNRINEISGHNKESIDTLVNEVARFKVE